MCRVPVRGEMGRGSIGLGVCVSTRLWRLSWYGGTIRMRWLVSMYECNWTFNRVSSSIDD